MDFYGSEEQEHFMNYQYLKQNWEKTAIQGEPEGLLFQKTVSLRNFLYIDKPSRFFFLFQDAAGRVCQFY